MECEEWRVPDRGHAKYLPCSGKSTFFKFLDKKPSRQSSNPVRVHNWVDSWAPDEFSRKGETRETIVIPKTRTNPDFARSAPLYEAEAEAEYEGRKCRPPFGLATWAVIRWFQRKSFTVYNLNSGVQDLCLHLYPAHSPNLWTRFALRYLFYKAK
jgi:hypothetical protein